jgi:hypothetical protein
MEEIVLAAKDKTPETLTEADLTTIRTHLPEAVALWQRIAARERENELFGFPNAKLATPRTQVDAEAEAPAELEGAVASGEAEAIIPRGVAIKPSFAALFTLFGDFETVG